MAHSSIRITQSDVKRAIRQQLSKVAQEIHRKVRSYPGGNSPSVRRAINKAVQDARRKLL